MQAGEQQVSRQLPAKIYLAEVTFAGPRGRRRIASRSAVDGPRRDEAVRHRASRVRVGGRKAWRWTLVGRCGTVPRCPILFGVSEQPHDAGEQTDERDARLRDTEIPTVELEPGEATTGTTKLVEVPPGPQRLTVRIPPGVRHNSVLRLPGARPDPAGGEPYDALLRIRIVGSAFDARALFDDAPELPEPPLALWAVLLRTPVLVGLGIVLLLAAAAIVYFSHP